jgi:Rieske 2Fe-2S family protein
MALGQDFSAGTLGAAGAGIGEGLEQVRQPVSEARHAPSYIYASPEVFQLEKKNIFMKDWLAVARVEEIEKPGDYMTFRILGEPLIVARNAKGELNAFSNICLHRGVEIAHGQGNAQQFSCPYHAWTYDLDGRLKAAAYMDQTKGFSRADCRLASVRLGVWAGWIFVNFDPEAVPLETFVAGFDKDFGFLRQEECRMGLKLAFDLECNWKLAVENVVDTYHIGTLHASTVGRGFVKRKGPEREPFVLRDKGGYIAFFRSGSQNSSGQPLFGSMPWLSEEDDDFSTSGRLAPNMTLFGHKDDTHVVVTWPVSPTRCQLIVYELFWKGVFDQPNFTEKANDYGKTLKKVIEEDRSMIESLQNAMSSERFRPGPMSFLELGVHHVMNSNLDRIFPRP